MSGLPTPATATRFLGVDLALPTLTAPFGADALFHPDGHLAVARANAAAGTASIVPEGIMTAEDARAAVAAGASAVVVSNHGGRQLDGQLASLDAPARDP
jgi:isopentenyl diphosphate isomerase/L-lactate dehydrogenase-like FMN-dependent dehydrogenase